MKQVLLSGKQALLARVPRPAVEPGSVLVQVQYSLISVGTELAPLKEALGTLDGVTARDRVAELSAKAAYYLGKAVNDPRAAARRLAQIASQRARRVAASASAFRPTPKSVPLGDLGWSKAGAGEFTRSGEGFVLKSDDTPAGYQIISRKLDISEVGRSGEQAPEVTAEAESDLEVPGGHGIVVSIRGRIGPAPYTLGVLSGDQSTWIAQIQLDPGPIDETVEFDLGSWSSAYLVLANAGVGGGDAEFSELKGWIREPGNDGMPVSELGQTGWGVGYSCAGEVVAVGEGVTGFAVGDRVACGGAGQANHAEFVSVKKNLVVSAPSNVPLHVACTATVGSIAMQGVRRADPRVGEVICVTGLGLIGLMTVQILRAAGCRVIGLDLDPARVQRALELGCDAATSDPDEYVRLSQYMTGGRGADSTIITAASKSNALVNGAMQTTRRRGKVVIVGDVGLDVERATFYRKEIDLLISSSYGPGRYDKEYEVDGIDYPYAFVRWTMNRNMSSYLDLIAQGKIDIESLIDELIPIEEAPKAYSALARSDKAPIGVVLVYSTTATKLQEAPVDAPDSSVIAIRGSRKLRGEKIGALLVGAGGFGISMLVPQMDKRRDVFALRGVVSRDPVRGGNFARQRGLEILATDLDSALRQPGVDLAVISTRHMEHADQVIQSLRAGKHVYVEKPLALSWDQLEQVRSEADAHPDLQIMIGFNRRFAPAIQMVRKELGGRKAPLMINYRLNGGYIPPDSWIQDNQGGGRNVGEACHMYDLFRSLTAAPPRRIEAQSIRASGSNYLANDNFSATITYEDGSVCNLVYTALGPKTGLPKERIEIFCEGKAFVIDDFVKCTSYPKGDVLWEASAADKGHATEWSMFADTLIAGGGEAPIPRAEIFETSAVALHIEDILMGRA